MQQDGVSLIYVYCSAPSKTVIVNLSVEHPSEDPHLGSVKQASVSVVIPAGGTALQVMENAANEYGSPYEFTAKYDGGSLHGFFIDKINGIPSNNTQTPPSDNYYWEFLIRYPNGTVKPSHLGISTYYFDIDGYGMIMRLTKIPHYRKQIYTS